MGHAPLLLGRESPAGVGAAALRLRRSGPAGAAGPAGGVGYAHPPPPGSGIPAGKGVNLSPQRKTSKGPMEPPWGLQPVEKPPGVRGTQCSSQRSRCVGPWGLPGAPLLTGLPPRSSRHWRRSALPSGGFDRIWRHKVNCPEGTREGPLGGCASNPQKALRSKGFPA